MILKKKIDKREVQLYLGRGVKKVCHFAHCGDPLVKGTATKDNMPLLEFSKSNVIEYVVVYDELVTNWTATQSQSFCPFRVRVSAVVGLGRGDFGQSEHVGCFGYKN